jgi:hypothetical protein
MELRGDKDSSRLAGIGWLFRYFLGQSDELLAGNTVTIVSTNTRLEGGNCATSGCITETIQVPRAPPCL